MMVASNLIPFKFNDIIFLHFAIVSPREHMYILPVACFIKYTKRIRRQQQHRDNEWHQRNGIRAMKMQIAYLFVASFKQKQWILMSLKDQQTGNTHLHMESVSDNVWLSLFFSLSFSVLFSSSLCVSGHVINNNNHNDNDFAL